MYKIHTVFNDQSVIWANQTLYVFCMTWFTFESDENEHIDSTPIEYVEKQQRINLLF